MNKKTYIYRLICPRTGRTKYIGKTNAPSGRLGSHIKDRDWSVSKAKGEWIDSLLAEGYEPVMDIIEVCDKKAWKEREAFWMAYYELTEGELTNAKLYGSVGHIRTNAKEKALLYFYCKKHNLTMNEAIKQLAFSAISIEDCIETAELMRTNA